MKGKITITSDEKGGVNFSGTVVLKGDIERYELISGLAKCLGVNSAESWAKCTLYCLSRLEDQKGLNRTEIEIPDFKV